MDAARELMWWWRLRDEDLPRDLDRDDDGEKQRDPPVAPSRAQPCDRDPQRNDADHLRLTEDRDERRGEVEPGRMRRLEQIEDRAIRAVRCVDGNQRGEREERSEGGEAAA